MNSLSGARKLWTLIVVERRDQRVHVDHRDAGIDHLVDRRGQRADAEGLDGDEIPFLGGHVVDRARCLCAASSPSNQVTSTLKSLPQYSAACLPWAHQVACRPALEKAAFSGLAERPISAAMAAGVMPRNGAVAAACSNVRRPTRLALQCRPWLPSPVGRVQARLDHRQACAMASKDCNQLPHPMQVITRSERSGRLTSHPIAQRGPIVRPAPRGRAISGAWWSASLSGAAQRRPDPGTSSARNSRRSGVPDSAARTSPSQAPRCPRGPFSSGRRFSARMRRDQDFARRTRAARRASAARWAARSIAR